MLSEYYLVINAYLLAFVRNGWHRLGLALVLTDGGHSFPKLLSSLWRFLCPLLLTILFRLLNHINSLPLMMHRSESAE